MSQDCPRPESNVRNSKRYARNIESDIRNRLCGTNRPVWAKVTRTHQSCVFRPMRTSSKAPSRGALSAFPAAALANVCC